MIFKCDHEHGGGRTTRCMHGCNDAWAPIGDPEPAAVAPPSAPPEPAFACLQCRTAFVTETEARKHRDTDLHTCVAWALIPSVRKAEILRAPECVRCSAAMTDGAQYCRDTDWTEPHVAAVSPPETTAPTATEPNEYQTGPCKCGHSHNLRLGGDVVQGCDMHGCRCKKFRAVSPVASSATPTPEPTKRFVPADLDALISFASRLASSQQEIEHLRGALAVIANGDATNAPALARAALTTEPR